MSKVKKFKKTLTVILGSTVGYLLLKFLYATQRWEYKFLDTTSAEIFHSKPIIMSFWHNQQLCMPRLFLGLRQKHTPIPYVMISKHTDGRLIARTVKFFGINSVAGSSSEGGKEALLAQIDLVRSGNSAVITPDGPRGPIYKLKKGVVQLAIATQAPIIPIAFGTKSYWQFSSWDRMILPKPFARGTFFIGKPLILKKNLTEQEISTALQHLESEMNSLMNLAGWQA